MQIDEEILQDLVKIKAVQLDPDKYFTWTSGIKSPIYCDNRLTMSFPKLREKITDAFIQIIQSNHLQPDVIAGCATAGIPHAAWLSSSLDLPMAYVRSKPKAHGKGNQIEGVIEPGQKVIVVEDLISTGGSSIASANALKTAGAEVIGVLAIFSYGLKEANEQFTQSGFKVNTITNLDKLLDVLVENKELKQDEKVSILAWRDNLTF